MKSLTNLIGRLLIMVMLFSSCSLNKLTFTTKKVDKIDKIALVSSFVQFHPATGLLHASIMNNKINSVGGEINQMMEEYAGIFRDSLAINLMKNCGCEVLYNESLHSNQGFEILKSKFNYPDALFTENKTFPNIYQAKDDINPFITIEPFTLTKPDVLKLQEIKPTIQELCKILNVNYIAVSYTGLVAVQGDAVSLGRLSLVTVFSIYDKEGDYIAYGNRVAGTRGIRAGNIEEYPPVFDSYFEAIKPMITQFTAKYSKP